MRGVRELRDVRACFFSAFPNRCAQNACTNQKIAAHRAAAGAAARALAAPDQHAPPDQPPEKISSGVAIPSSPISKTTHVPRRLIYSAPHFDLAYLTPRPCPPRADPTISGPPRNLPAGQILARMGGSAAARARNRSLSFLFVATHARRATARRPDAPSGRAPSSGRPAPPCPAISVPPRDLTPAFPRAVYFHFRHLR